MSTIPTVMKVQSELYKDHSVMVGMCMSTTCLPQTTDSWRLPLSWRWLLLRGRSHLKKIKVFTFRSNFPLSLLECRINTFHSLGFRRLCDTST